MRGADLKDPQLSQHILSLLLHHYCGIAWHRLRHGWSTYVLTALPCRACLAVPCLALLYLLHPSIHTSYAAFQAQSGRPVRARQKRIRCRKRTRLCLHLRLCLAFHFHGKAHLALLCPALCYFVSCAIINAARMWFRRSSPLICSRRMTWRGGRGISAGA